MKKNILNVVSILSFVGICFILTIMGQRLNRPAEFHPMVERGEYQVWEVLCENAEGDIGIFSYASERPESLDYERGFCDSIAD